MHEVERAGVQAGVSCVRAQDLDVVQTPLSCEPRRHRDVSGIGVESDNPPAGRNPIG